MKTNLRTKIAASIMVMGLGLASGVNAQVPLPAGSTVFNTDGAMEASLGSFTLLASMSSAFISGPNTAAFSGVLDSYVLRGDSNNPLGGLDFVYRVTNSIDSTDAIHRLTVNGFSGFLTETGFLNDGSTPTGGVVAGGLTPTLADRGIAPGDNAGFSFLSGTISGLTFNSLNPGETSRYLVLYTNATEYGNSIASVIDGSTASAATFAPIPEPETYALMLAGLGLMGFIGRRRSAKKTS